METARIRVALVVGAGMLGPVASLACGDKLAMIGGGVSFERINQSTIRGNVVMIVPPSSSLRAANEALDLKGTLERAGHRVRTVDDLGQLASILAAGTTDVVLVDLGDAGQLKPAARAGDGAEPPSVLTVLYNPRDEELEAANRQGKCVTRADKRRGHQLLEAVDQMLVRREKRLPEPCVTPEPARSI